MRVLVTVALVVAAAVAAPPAAATGNEAPMAEAGLDQSVHRGTTVVLDAGGSYDPDGDVAAYDWSIRTPEGRVIGPEDHEARRTTFVARHVGEYVVTLTVTDDDGATATDTAYVDVVPGAPGGDSPGDDPSGPADGGGSGENATDGGATDRSGTGQGADDGGSSGVGDGGTGEDVDRPGDGTGSVDDGGTGSENATDGGSGPGTPGAGEPSDPDGTGDGEPGSAAPGGPDDTSDASDGDPADPGAGDGANTPPWATIDGPSALRPGERATYELSAGDAEGRIAAVEWAGGGSGLQVTRTAPASGNLTLSVSVGDREGGLTVVTRTVRVASGENRPPEVELLPPGPVHLGETVRFRAVVDDPDGHVASVSVVPNRTIQFGAVRPHTVRVRARDDDGAVATDTLRVTPHRTARGDAVPATTAETRFRAVAGVRQGLLGVTADGRRR